MEVTHKKLLMIMWTVSIVVSAVAYSSYVVTEFIPGVVQLAQFLLRNLIRAVPFILGATLAITILIPLIQLASGATLTFQPWKIIDMRTSP